MSTQTHFTLSGQVVLDASGLAQDRGGNILGRPFYDAAVRDAVQELCFDTNWDHRSTEKLIPENRMLKLPKMGGLRNLWLFNGEECNISLSTPMWLKENYKHKGSEGYFANQQGQNLDPIVGNTLAGSEPAGSYFGGIENDILYFSTACRQFQRVRIEYVGLGQDDPCEVPAVPTWARQAITYWVARRACQMRERDGSLFSQLERKYAEQVDGPMGAWKKAQKRYLRLDKKGRLDVNVYTTTFGKGRW